MARQSSRPRLPRMEFDNLSIPDEVADSLCSCGGVEGLVEKLPPDDLFEQMQGRHQACADPVRLKILALLMIQPLCVCVIKTIVKMADSKLSYHLTILKKAGLIEGVQQGNYIIYQITPDTRTYVDGEFKRYGYNLSQKRSR